MGTVLVKLPYLRIGGIEKNSFLNYQVLSGAVFSDLRHRYVHSVDAIRLEIHRRLYGQRA